MTCQYDHFSGLRFLQLFSYDSLCETNKNFRIANSAAIAETPISVSCIVVCSMIMLRDTANSRTSTT